MARMLVVWLLVACFVAVPAYAQQSAGTQADRTQEAAKAAQDSKPEQERKLSLEERVELLEKKLKASKVGDSGVLKRLRVNFELELEWLYAQRDRVVPARRGQLDKFTIEVDARFSEHVSLVAQGRFEADEAWVKTAYAELDNLPCGQRLRFGLDGRIFKPTRRTESYPLVGSAFWRTHDFGISYRIKVPDGDSHAYMKAAVANGLTLDSRKPGEQEQYYLVSDKKPDALASLGENEEYSLALGARCAGGKKQWLDVSLFGLVSRLDDSDAAFLNLHINPVDPKLGTAERGDSKWRRGGALSARCADFFFQGMYILARDSDLFREGYYVQPSYRLPLRRGWLRSVEVLLRAGHLRMQMDKSTAQPMSWDRDELTIGALLEIRKGVTVKMEYTAYDEDPGKGEKQVKNNEFLFQLEFKF